MSAHLRQLLALYDARNLRERALLTAVVLALIWSAWFWTLWPIQSAEYASQRMQVQQLAQRVQGAQALVTQMQSDSGETALARLQGERKALQRQLDAVSANLDELLLGFVNPNEMALVLEDLLRSHRGVKLKQLRNLPVQPLLTDDSEAAEGLYRHALEIELSGAYFDLLAYLEALEESPWRLMWQRLSYKVEAHPKASMTLKVETLSRHPRWLGV